MLDVQKPEYDPNLPDCIICDVDGTLADRGSRNAFDFKRVGEDTVKESIRDLVKMLRYGTQGLWNHQGFAQVIIFSGRDDSCQQETEQWLKSNNIQFDALFMRKTGDKRKDAIVKKELYEAHVKGKYNCLYWVDDRRQVIDMVRNELGLCCLDVAGHDF